MKGFLQRIAASVTQSAPRMHPLVEPIYAAPHAAEQAAPSVYVESTVRSAAPLLRIRESSVLDSSEDRMQFEGNPTVPHSSNGLPRAVMGTAPDSFEPLLKPSAAKSTLDSIAVQRRSEVLAGTNKVSFETTGASGVESSYSPAQAEMNAFAQESLPIVA